MPTENQTTTAKRSFLPIAHPALRRATLGAGLLLAAGGLSTLIMATGPDGSAEEQTEKAKSTDSPVATIEGDEHQSALRKFVRENDELREKLHNIPWDDVENKLCFVRSTPFEQGSGLRLITIAAVEISGLTSMLCGLFFACRIDIREGETINGGGRSRFGYAVPNSRFMGVFLCEDTSTTNSNQSVVPASELEGQLRRLMKLRQTEPARVRERLVEMFFL